MDQNNKFSIFCIDPPWPKQKGGKRSIRPKQDKHLNYKTLSVLDIFTLLDKEIFPSAIWPHNIFMWTVDEFLTECETRMLRRGYKKHARLIWDKGNGVAPAFTVRYSHEYVIWWYKPTFPGISKDTRGKYSTVLRENSREHSRKPDCFYKMVEDWYPNEKKLDVFSREKRKGWEQYGDEIDYYTFTKEIEE